MTPARVDPARQVVFHDNFCQMGGAERVAEELHRILSELAPTDLASTLTAEERMTPYLRDASIRNTWMQHLPARARLSAPTFCSIPSQSITPT